jgi:hypothetical protein
MTCGHWGWGDIPPPPSAEPEEIDEYILKQIAYYEDNGCHTCTTPDSAFSSVIHWTTCSHLRPELQSDWPDVPVMFASYAAAAAWIRQNTDYWN